MTSSLVAHLVLGCCLVALTGITDEAPLGTLARHPFIALAWLTGVMLLDSINSMTTSVGAQWCPAAASSTIFTSTQMTLGYVADIVVHGTTPDALTIIGASLMLLAVMFMTV